ncbi:hypothetical protein Q1695_008858 [Nippostrongylus brasiliensis]|nr:hypothetical protein Q1695_008858 [Nippostrongylus brasiliensis]
MVRRRELGVKKLIAKLRPLKITFNEVETTDTETLKTMILSDLTDELKGSRADAVLTATIEQCQKTLAEPSFHEQYRRTLPRNRGRSASFKRLPPANSDHLHQFLTAAAMAFPSGFLGAKNTQNLIEVMVRALTSWKAYESLEIPFPELRMLESDSCRSLRHQSKKFSKPVPIVQHELLHKIMIFFTKFLLKNLMYNSYFCAPRDNSAYLIFDGRSFRRARAFEKQKFIKDYKVVLSDGKSKQIRSFSLNTALRRPIVQCMKTKMENRNELQLMGALLDAYMRLHKQKGAGGVAVEARRLHKYLKDYKSRRKAAESSGKEFDERLYFLKADVQNCFACVNRELLRQAMMQLVGKKDMGYAIGFAKSRLGKAVRLVRAAPTQCEARKLLLKTMKKKGLTDPNVVEESIIRHDYVMWSVLGMLHGLRIHLDNSDVKYEMKKGVPQGYELSPRLAHIYLLKFEGMIWQHLHPRTCLLRYADDYLVCATQKTEIQKILNTLLTKNRFGVSARLSKCEVSFPIPGIRQSGRYIKWCGRLLDMKELKISRTWSDAQLVRARHLVGNEYARRRRLLRARDWQAENAPPKGRMIDLS